MERYKDSDHALLVLMLIVLIFVWLSAFICFCFVCLSPFVSDGLSVCLCPSVSRILGVCVSLCFSWLYLYVCLSRSSCVSFSVCSVCFGDCCSLVLAWAALSYLALVRSVWFCLRVTSLFVVFALPFVRLSFGCSVRSFFSLFLLSSKACHVQVFSHAKANKVQQLVFERFIIAAPPVLSKEHTARTRELPGMFWDDTSQVAI